MREGNPEVGQYYTLLISRWLRDSLSLNQQFVKVFKLLEKRTILI
jgi:hypothetical protein